MTFSLMIEKPSTKNNSNSKINLNDLREEIHLHRYKSKSVKLKIRFYKFIYLTSSYFRIIIFFFFTHHESTMFLNTALHACKSNFSTRERVLPVRSS